jgi:hypothetical protein
MNALSLSASDPNTQVKFLGVNARVGFSFPEDSSTWKTTLMLGVYSLGMWVSNNSLGFDRLYGPQLILAERYGLDPISSLSGYVKYSTLLAGSQLSLSQRELAGGIAYERRVGRYNYSAGFDASVFDFSIGAIQIQSRTLTFSLGMRL